MEEKTVKEMIDEEVIYLAKHVAYQVGYTVQSYRGCLLPAGSSVRAVEWINANRREFGTLIRSFATWTMVDGRRIPLSLTPGCHAYNR